MSHVFCPPPLPPPPRFPPTTFLPFVYFRPPFSFSFRSRVLCFTSQGVLLVFGLRCSLSLLHHTLTITSSTLPLPHHHHFHHHHAFCMLQGLARHRAFPHRHHTHPHLCTLLTLIYSFHHTLPLTTHPLPTPTCDEYCHALCVCCLAFPCCPSPCLPTRCPHTLPSPAPSSLSPHC